MRRAVINAALFCVLTAACAQLQPVSFTHPTADQAQYERDKAQCIYEVSAATASYSSGSTSRTLAGAMGQGFGEGLAMASRQRELGILCMKARGYTPQATAQP